MSDAPAPLVPAEVDLRGLEYMPFFGTHLFGSEFNAVCTDAEWRAGLTLWWAAWNQQPAGSLPDDDGALCRLADLGRDLKAWNKIKGRALHGFVKCSDGRLYHGFLCRQVLVAWEKRVQERERKRKWREKKQGQDADGDGDRTGTTGGTERGRNADVPADGNRRDVTGRDGTGRELKTPRSKASTADAVAGTDPVKDEIWRTGRAILEGEGKSRDAAGSFLGRLCKDFGQVLVLQAVRDCHAATPAKASEWLIARCQERRRVNGSGNAAAAAEAKRRIFGDEKDVTDESTRL